MRVDSTQNSFYNIHMLPLCVLFHLKEDSRMSYYNQDTNGYLRDKSGNYKPEDFQKAIEDGVLKEYDCGRKVYDPETKEEFWPDGTKK